MSSSVSVKFSVQSTGPANTKDNNNYGYGGLSAEDLGEETDSSDADEVDDELGPEDSEGVENEIEVLGYSNF